MRVKQKFSDPLNFSGFFSDPLNFSKKISDPLKNAPSGYPAEKMTGPLCQKENFQHLLFAMTTRTDYLLKIYYFNVHYFFLFRDIG